jgi:outer membrane protein insertion porin family
MRFLKRLGIAVLIVATALIMVAGPRVKKDLARSLIGLLDDEAKACNGRITYEEADISLLTLRAEARNVRLVRDGSTGLLFKRITAQFSLKEIFSKTILLTSLTLSEGESAGVGPDSATFQFIDRLTTPSPNPNTNRFRLKLMGIDVTNSTFREEFRSAQLAGSGMTMEVRRQPDDTFVLKPFVKQLVVKFPQPSLHKEVALGAVSTTIHIQDHQTLFQALTFLQDRSKTVFDFNEIYRDHHALSGTVSMNLDGASYGLAPTLSGTIQASGSVSGTIGSPRFEGPFETTPPFMIAPGGILPVPIESASGHYFVDVNHGNPRVGITDATAVGPTCRMEQATVELHNDNLSGQLTIFVGSLSTDSLGLHDARIRISLSGTLNEILPQFELSASYGRFLDYSLGPVSGAGNYRGSLLHFTLRSPGDTLSASGAIDFGPDDPVLTQLQAKASGLRVQDLRGSSLIDDLLIHGTLQLSGPLAATALKGGGQFTIDYLPPVPGRYTLPNALQGSYRLAGGLLKFDGADESGKLRSTGTLDVSKETPSEIRLALADYVPPIKSASDLCSKLSLQTDYRFTLADPFRGNGAVTLSGARLGCAPYVVSAATPRTLPIKDGFLLIDQLAAAGSGSAFILNGNISLIKGYAFGGKGTLQLESLLDLFPVVDDVSGHLDFDLSVSGQLGSPSFSGDVKLSDGILGHEGTGIEVTHLGGSATIEGAKVAIKEVSGSLNGGTVFGSGTFSFSPLSDTHVAVQYENASLDPMNNLSVVSSGALTFSFSPSAVPQIGGTIRILSAEFEKSVDLAMIARALSSTLLGLQSNTSTNAATGQAPANLNIFVTAPNNVYAATNWAESELKVALNVSGSPLAPVLKGRLETLNGWFGFKDKKFSLISGSVTFDPEKSAPILDILGQASVTARSGEANTILLEAIGPADSPRLTLSSDRGMSQREIIALLTGGTEDLSRNPVSRFGLALNYRDVSLLGQDTPILGGNILSRLVRIDSLSLEPTYNNLTGGIEPAVIATKKISDNVTLLGEGLFGGTITESRARLDYRIADSLNLTGTIESSSLRQYTTFGLDAALTIKSQQYSPVKILLEGNEQFEDSQVFEMASIKKTRPLEESEIRLMETKIVEGYKSLGYFDATAVARCLSDTRPCDSVTVLITEGDIHAVNEVRLEGPNLGDILPHDEIASLSQRAYATSSFQQNTRSLLLHSLRERGYLSARVQSQFTAADRPNRQNLIISVTPGTKYTFIFEGNKHFTAIELLATMNLLDRNQPFGNNSISLLIDKIEEAYRRAGFLYASVAYEKERSSQDNRLIYKVTIQEEEKVAIDRVYFEGMTSFSEASLRREIKQLERTIRGLEIRRPKVAVDEQLAENVKHIGDIYRAHGYPNPEITYRIDPLTPRTAAIHYLIAEGPQVLYTVAGIEGLPEAAIAPEISTEALQISKVNELFRTVSSRVAELGYLHSSVRTQLTNPGEVKIVVAPGEITTIGAISVIGTRNVSPQVIRSVLRVSEGEPWNSARIDESRRAILRLGLFARVAVEPRNKLLNQYHEDLVIQVTERPLSYLRVGAGANSQFGAHLFGEASDRSLFSDGRALTLRADLYVDPAENAISQGVSSFLFSIPDVLRTPYSLVEDFRFQKITTTTQEFDVERTTLSSYLYRSNPTGLATTFGHSLARESILNVPTDARLGPFDSGIISLSSLHGSLTYDHRDDPLNPKEGYFVSSEATLASRLLGSQVSYGSATFRASTILPLAGAAGNWALAGSVRGGYAKTFGNSEAIPITQRFYLGGRNSVRGFRENSLGPLGSAGSVIGGDMLAMASMQLQYRAAERTSLHVFVDMGNVFLRRLNPSPFDLRESAGLGLQLLSPIGPVGFDLGFPMHPENNEPRSRFHFTIGSNF